MPSAECPFLAPIIKEDCACSKADMVSVRNTPKVHCLDDTSLSRCLAVYANMKSVGLDAFGMEDDLTTTPHNTYLKIQYGGLTALAGSIDAQVMQNLDVLIGDAVTAAGNVGALDYAMMTPYMLKVKTRRRR